VAFQANLSERARWELDHLGPEAASQILDCIDALTRNPYRDIDQRVTLVMPLDRVYRDAYRCGDRAIGYDFQDEDTLLIQAIGNLYY
jgi:mRNA-degrading endonuclease RelE of RelBE toxin-antitoxin system